MTVEYFIDSENVGDFWIPLLELPDEETELIVFYTKNSPHMSYDSLIRLKESEKKVTFIKCYEGTNALDFQLVSELGYRICQNEEGRFVIVTNDTGYDAAVKYWRRRKRSVKRITGKECRNLERRLREDILGSDSILRTPRAPRAVSREEDGDGHEPRLTGLNLRDVESAARVEQEEDLHNLPDPGTVDLEENAADTLFSEAEDSHLSDFESETAADGSEGTELSEEAAEESETPEGFAAEAEESETLEDFAAEAVESETPDGFAAEAEESETPDGFAAEADEFETPDDFSAETEKSEAPEDFAAEAEESETPQEFAVKTEGSEVSNDLAAEQEKAWTAEAFVTGTDEPAEPAVSGAESDDSANAEEPDAVSGGSANAEEPDAESDGYADAEESASEGGGSANAEKPDAESDGFANTEESAAESGAYVDAEEPAAESDDSAYTEKSDAEINDSANAEESGAEGGGSTNTEEPAAESAGDTYRSDNSAAEKQSGSEDAPVSFIGDAEGQMALPLAADDVLPFFPDEIEEPGESGDGGKRSKSRRSRSRRSRAASKKQEPENNRSAESSASEPESVSGAASASEASASESEEKPAVKKSGNRRKAADRERVAGRRSAQSGHTAENVPAHVPETPAAAPIPSEEEIARIAACIGADNLAELHNQLATFYGDQGKDIYLSIKNGTRNLSDLHPDLKQKFDYYCEIIFAHSEEPEEVPADMAEYLMNIREKLGNLNSLRYALIKHYGKEKGRRYYFLLKPYAKTMHQM